MNSDIIKKIESAQNIAIICHDNPDGDAIGSLLGLGTTLENMGKKVFFCAPSKPSKIFEFLPGFGKIKIDFDYGNYDLIIFVDCSENKRLGIISKGKEEYFENKDIIIFDHHESNEKKEYMINDPQASSCCEVIFETIKDIWEKYITPEIATYFYLGLTTDSGNFRYDEDHERIFTNALNLIKYGADKKLITDNLINSKSYETINFMKTILNRMIREGNILYSYYNEDELNDYGIEEEQAGYGLTVIQEIKGPKIIMTIRKFGDNVKCSMRSKNIDIAKIAQRFGGGGHEHAAGFTYKINGTFENTIKEVIKKINEQIKD